MGCTSSRPEQFNIEEEYRKKNLPMPDATLFENDFEKEAYFTVNLFRADPKLLIKQIKDVKGKTFTSLDLISIKHDFFNLDTHLILMTIGNKLYKGKKWSQLVKELEKMEENTLHPIAVDETTLKACREYNDKIIDTPDQEVPTTGGGNGEKYKELLGAQAKSGDVEEFTYTQWGGNAIELLLLNLL